MCPEGTVWLQKRRMSFAAFKLLPRSFDHVHGLGDGTKVMYIMVIKNVPASVFKTSSGECVVCLKLGL